MSPPTSGAIQATPAGTTRSGDERNRLIAATAVIVENCGLEMSPRRIHRLVQTFQDRAERNGFAFFDFLANTVQLDAAGRRKAMANPDIARAISYADPTGEQAVANVMGVDHGR